MKHFDLVGVGVGPFNLSTAALCDSHGVNSLFLDRNPGFDWHPGMMIDNAKMQVPFLADLVSLAEPAHELSFLSYLHSHSRLFHFYFHEDIYPTRREYVDYCQWVTRQLSNLRFGAEVTRISPAPGGGFTVEYSYAGDCTTVHASHVVLGVGTEPTITLPFSERAASNTGNLERHICHSGDYLTRVDEISAAKHVCVVGSGQSGAEVFLDQLRRRPAGNERLTWLTRSPAIAPMEHSKLGLEHFTPEYMAYFQTLPESARHRLFAEQWQLYKAISDLTISNIFDELYRRSVCDSPDVHIHPATTVTEVDFHDGSIQIWARDNDDPRVSAAFDADFVIAATGYRPRNFSELLFGIEFSTDSVGAPRVDSHHRLRLSTEVTGNIYTHNVEHSTHGVGTPDLGLTAWRSLRIITDITGGDISGSNRGGAFISFELSGDGRV
ncbi:lysine N(6)-hydroxylase/L-ornithine N(5)-oxygenase family protein [Corynebacterium sp. TAE3-ERU16]|uniref:lysine N(6)-hydroxylase/L-ornithine N(5)-oxygenase family protein n=1 Tax=Corynebacterium sp. TAE3-ERU16 TaxID=2849493 RepID=UPI001C44184B|nr:SidA/IucD/PvdA family monooxygenase [Corynebacterium sp. TAE3-ERU16]MBV7292917.1 SidA/IucD/PvdA family monooxygenase [Corynebacterium sp. TAE3-ERU16]